VKADGSVEGIHKPSSELPFHRLVYRTRPDLKAVVHAHPPALVSFSIVRRIPDTRMLPTERKICGEIGMAEYALPGSEELGRNIADVFAQGIDTVMLENHGIVIGGPDLFEAFKIFETLDFCARLEIKANTIGKPVLLSEEHYETVAANEEIRLETFRPTGYSAKERELRREMIKFIQRAYDQQLFTSTQGTFSQRLDDGSFIITPYDMDRKYMDVEHLVRVDQGKVEEGKQPSRSLKLHENIYEQHPHVDSVIIAHPPNIMAFAVTEDVFDSRTIPESYILLRGTPKLNFSAIYTDPKSAAASFTKDTPIALVENNCVIVTGQSLLNAFDRLEVAEYSAKAIISSRCIGDIVPIDDKKIRDIEEAFGLA
jgi:L-fuculose-phosphate aldolase